jgi:hypothetical protein
MWEYLSLPGFSELLPDPRKSDSPNKYRVEKDE